jgi:cell wall assembly regulator SMI1
METATPNQPKEGKMIYTTKTSDWQVTVNPRPNGLETQVSFWNGEDFEIRYEKFVIAESWYEAITDALLESGFGDWASVEEQATQWGITPPDDEE